LLHAAGQPGEEARDDLADKMDAAEYQLRELVAEIELLVSEETRAAANWLVGQATMYLLSRYSEVRADFLEAARRDLGIPSGE